MRNNNRKERHFRKNNSGGSGPKIGQRLADGWIYAGISPDTGRPYSAYPVDAGVMTWKKAQEHATLIRRLGHDNARLPTIAELASLWRHSDKGALAGTFNESGAYPQGWYFSSSLHNFNEPFDLRFSDGQQISMLSDTGEENVRVVRDEPILPGKRKAERVLSR